MRISDWSSDVFSSDLEGSTPVRPGFAFDEAALSRWMADHVPGFEGPLSVEQFQGGQSNPTYKLVTPGRSYVLRRKPPGQLLKGAPAVDREVAVLMGLEKGSIPVATVLWRCTAHAVIGHCLSIIERGEGRSFLGAAQ